MEAVDRANVTVAKSCEERAAVEVAVNLTHSPGIAEIVLAAGADHARHRFPIDPEEVITLSPPAVLVIGDREIAANKSAAALRLEQ